MTEVERLDGLEVRVFGSKDDGRSRPKSEVLGRQMAVRVEPRRHSDAEKKLLTQRSQRTLRKIKTLRSSRPWCELFMNSLWRISLVDFGFWT